MWPRICEIILGIWLFSSHFIFSTDLWEDLVIAVLIFIFSLLSYFEKINKMHLFQIIPIGWLLYISYSYPTPWLPFYLQNYILVALGLLVFAIVPSRASDPPRAWRDFLGNRES